MKRLPVYLSVAALLIVGGAFGGQVRRLTDPQSLTETAPSAGTVTTTIHFSLADLQGYRITACADSGQTLTNVTIDQYYIDPAGANLWTINPALQLTATSVSKRCITFPDQRVSAIVEGAYLMAVSNGSTVSSGAITIYYQGFGY